MTELMTAIRDQSRYFGPCKTHLKPKAIISVHFTFLRINMSNQMQSHTSQLLRVNAYR